MSALSGMPGTLRGTEAKSRWYDIVSLFCCCAFAFEAKPEEILNLSRQLRALIRMRVFHLAHLYACFYESTRIYIHAHAYDTHILVFIHFLASSTRIPFSACAYALMFRMCVCVLFCAVCLHVVAARVGRTKPFDELFAFVPCRRRYRRFIYMLWHCVCMCLDDGGVW